MKINTPPSRTLSPQARKDTAIAILIEKFTEGSLQLDVIAVKRADGPGFTIKAIPVGFRKGRDDA